MRAFGIADQFSIQVRDDGQIGVIFSADITSHVRDAALWLADDPTAGETRDEATRDLLAELGEALSDALGMVGAQHGSVDGAGG